MKSENSKDKEVKSMSKDIVYDKYAESLGPLYVGKKSLSERQNNAMLRLGPHCPKCGELATAFEVVHNPLMDAYQGLVECTAGKCGRKKMYALLFHEDTNVWEFKREIKGGRSSLATLSEL